MRISDLSSDVCSSYLSPNQSRQAASRWSSFIDFPCGYAEVADRAKMEQDGLNNERPRTTHRPIQWTLPSAQRGLIHEMIRNLRRNHCDGEPDRDLSD